MNRRHQPLTLSVLAAALLALAAPACASMQQRVTEEENRSNTIENQVADLQAMQQEIITRLSALRADLEVLQDPLRAEQRRTGVDMGAVQTELVALRQQVTLLTTQLQAMAASGTTTAPQTTPAMPAADPAESADESIFNTAYGDYTAGQFVLAISGFEEFTRLYPDSPRAADAVYWIAESLAAQNEHSQARRRFLEIPRLYPRAAKVPDALLRAALEAVELGQITDAITELRQLVAAHAQSDAALIGCMQLDRLGQSLPSGCQAA